MLRSNTGLKSPSINIGLRGLDCKESMAFLGTSISPCFGFNEDVAPYVAKNLKVRSSRLTTVMRQVKCADYYAEFVTPDSGVSETTSLCWNAPSITSLKHENPGARFGFENGMGTV